MDIQQTINPGATVYGSDGEKVGTVATYTSAYIVVAKGFFFPKDYYIPLTAVAETSGEAVYLSVTKDDALNQGWDQEPAENWDTAQQDINNQSATTQAAGYTTEQDILTVPVHEEHLTASTRLADAGDVTISKQVVTEQETIQVPVTEERVRVEWREPTGEVTADGGVFEEGVIEVPVSREVVDVSKRTVQTGELEVTKERAQRTQKVTDSVRREVVEVEDTTDDIRENR
jgi:uncharacterized protein (TIGR02271 family)